MCGSAHYESYESRQHRNADLQGHCADDSAPSASHSARGPGESACDFTLELRAKGATPEEVFLAVRKLVTESPTLTASAVEEGDDEVVDARVGSCLDTFAAN
jgi:hypothetical protein